MRAKPILLFLVLTFGLTWGVESYLIADGLSFQGVIDAGAMLKLVAIMWIPGLCAMAVHRFVERRSMKELGLRFGSWQGYLIALLLISLGYFMIYGLTWLLGLGKPDWDMSALLALNVGASPGELSIITLLGASILIGPIGNIIPALGEELGWRGFLLPRLMPLGKTRAYPLIGLIWGLWHVPLILAGFNYPGYPTLGILMMILGCTAFGALFNEMTLKYRSVLLAAFLHAALNAQGYGIWHYLFPNVNPVLGGDTGLTGFIVWSAMAVIAVRTFKAQPE